MSTALFTPIKVGLSALKHRVVLAPLTRLRASMDNVPTDLALEYYSQRASEGGLLITEATLISPFAGGVPQAPGIFTEEQINGWKRITDEVHKKGAHMYLQLWHKGRVSSRLLNPTHEQIVSASAIPVSGKNDQGLDYEVPRALKVEEIKSVVQDFRQASVRAIKAGFDGVEIHGANGYLVDQFINSGSNKRTDQYGGSVVDAVSDAIGAERTAIRFSPGGEYLGMQDDTVVETWSYLTSQLQKNHPNLAYLHFIESRDSREDSLTPYRRIWKGPFISAGGFSTDLPYAVDMAERTGNLISFGRAFIANPDLPARIQHGWELNKYNRATFYGHTATGYTDYPFYHKQ
ncbi:12-oxo-phytodienoic acid-like protein [Blakeslea trispora]|nr:12-oxo-phytodienoic acid-like protein [Blakeslea trispora]